MTNGEYCKKCVMKSSNPGIVIDKNGVCNICNNTEYDSFYKNFKKSIKYYNKFKADMSSKDKSRKYDCIVMFSGGKDSINILHKFAKEHNLRVLALTINLPFESETSKANIEKVVSELDVDHISLTPSTSGYIELMRSIFTQKQGDRILNVDGLTKYKHLSPCIACTSFIKIMSCFIAERFNIPYVLYCADPGQMANLPINIENTIEAMKSVFDVDFINYIFNDDIDKLDSKKNPNAPIVIYPYIAIPDYDPNKIISKLKALGLYDSTPQEGHCILWSLLNYNAIKKYDSPFYILDYAHNIRNGKLDRDNTIQFLEAFKNMMFKVGEGKLTPKDDVHLRNILDSVFTTKGEFEYTYSNIMKMSEIANKLDISLSDI
ncbi:hypothetical protein [Wukongibacter sp. M2B1]|uniref:hypothetical protein n=1 Tax=Wukongibacter sp. M2B1 TaxID=3088895 RepID=UPI003D7A795D